MSARRSAGESSRPPPGSATRRNVAARRMVMGRSSSIGLVLPLRFQRLRARALRPHRAWTWRPRANAASFFFARWGAENEADCLRRVKAEKLDGIVLMYEAGGTGIYDYLEREGIPAVLCAITRPDLPFASVHVDETAAAAEATAHLIGLGHRRIAHLTGAQASFPRQRELGYRLSLEEAGLALDEGLVVSSEGYHRGGWPLERPRAPQAGPPLHRPLRGHRTSSPSARCAPSPRQGSRCPGTSPSSASTIST